MNRHSRKILQKDYILEILSLKFRGENAYLEQDFINDYLESCRKYTRASFVIGILFYSFFGLLDILIIPEQRNILWIIRFLIVDPFIILILLISYTEKGKKHIEFLGLLSLIVTGGGISVMVAVTSPPVSYSYYAGIILVLIFGYGILHIRFKWAALGGWANVFIYEIISVFIIETPVEVLINNNFFFISANLIGMLSCFASEKIIRKNFLFARLLETERGNIDHLNKNLEYLVNERTAELVEVNEALKSEIENRINAEDERKRLEKYLFEAQKMESIGNLAGGIAHDFNNILASLMAYTELSQELAEDGSELKEYLESIYKSGTRASELVKQILSYARKSGKKNESVRLDIILNEVIKLIRSTIPSNIEIKQTIDCQSYIYGNQSEIHQMFMNLFTNASYAMRKDGGILTIDMTDILIGPDKYVQIKISDTGEGIQEDIIESVFEPYFTTKETGDGTGLGLAVVQGVIKSCGGDISVKSRKGKGTVFSIWFPATEKEAVSSKAQTLSIPRGSEHILLVDDEADIAETGRLILTRLGYNVTASTESLKALELYKKTPEFFDLVVTDMMMPDLNGENLAEKINQINSGIPVLICSGFNDRENEISGTDKRYFLNKPYSIQEIAVEVRKALDEK